MAITRRKRVLRVAARRTLTFALAAPPEPGGLAAFCASGRVVTASRTTADAIKRTARPVDAELEHDPRTSTFIRRIQQMKQQFPAPVSLAVCRH